MVAKQVVERQQVAVQTAEVGPIGVAEYLQALGGAAVAEQV